MPEREVTCQPVPPAGHRQQGQHTEPGRPQVTPFRAVPISVESTSSTSDLTLAFTSSYRDLLSCPQQQKHTSLPTANRPGPKDFNPPWSRVLHLPPSSRDPLVFPLQTQGSDVKAGRKTPLTQRKVFPLPFRPMTAAGG